MAPLTHSTLTLGILLSSRGGGKVFRDRHGFISIIWSITDWGTLLPYRDRWKQEVRMVVNSHWEASMLGPHFNGAKGPCEEVVTGLS
jgi:hypothetical protein